jgi:hypothetical protein
MPPNMILQTVRKQNPQKQIINSGTHTAHLNEQRPFFLLFLNDNARNMKNYSRSIGLIFIEDFIFLVKKNFLTKFQKLASERNFDVSKKF